MPLVAIPAVQLKPGRLWAVGSLIPWLMLLHLNVKHCLAAGAGANRRLEIAIGRHIDGLHGVVERNTVRYYLAMRRRELARLSSGSLSAN